MARGRKLFSGDNEGADPLAAGVLGGMALTAHAASDITIGGNATLTTDYVLRGITQTAGNPIQGQFDICGPGRTPDSNGIENCR
jgi:hypothetical protein